MFEHLATVAQVEKYVGDAYRDLGRPGGGRRLPLGVASASALMQHAVELSGERGLSRQELKRIFGPLGVERFDSALAGMLSVREVVQVSEDRPNKVGRNQAQAVYYSPSRAPVE